MEQQQKQQLQSLAIDKHVAMSLSTPPASEIVQDKPISIDALTREMGETYAKVNVNATPSIPGIDGIRFDFRCGLRLQVPHGAEKTYLVRVWDSDSGLVVANLTMKAGDVYQAKRFYYRRYFIRVWDAAKSHDSVPLMEHHFNLKDRVVVIRMPVETIGDTLAWFPAVEAFRKKHECKLYVSVSKHMRKLLEPAYPELTFINNGDEMSINAYAQYQIGIEMDGEGLLSPYDWRIHPLAYVSYHILGLDPGEHDFGNTPPKIAYDKSRRLIKEPYVCIGAMASGGCKLWLEPRGWGMVIDFLKECGYRVICIDGNNITGEGMNYHRIPSEAEDCTGKGANRSLADRASMLHHADFFVGVGSGLSWLSWAVGRPTVLISGFSKPFCEFHTPYRVANPHACVGCFNDQRHVFDNHDNFFCPLHRGTKRQLICSLTITPEMVIGQITRIPEFLAHLARVDKSVHFEEKSHTVNSKYQPTSFPFEYKVKSNSGRLCRGGQKAASADDNVPGSDNDGGEGQQLPDKPEPAQVADITNNGGNIDDDKGKNGAGKTKMIKLEA